jgi:transposase
MVKDPFVREKFTGNLNHARKLAAEYFERFPKERYHTEVARVSRSSASNETRPRVKRRPMPN